MGSQWRFLLGKTEINLNDLEVASHKPWFSEILKPVPNFYGTVQMPKKQRI